MTRKEHITDEIKELSPTDFTPKIAQAHYQVGLEFPLNGPWTPNRIELVGKRAQALGEVRRGIASAAASHFGRESDEAHALIIFADIAPYLDKIFMAQLSRFKRTPLSWAEADEGSTNQLSTTIDQILQSPNHQRFLADNPFFYQTLLRIQSDLLAENRSERLDLLPKLFINLGLEAYRQNKPMLLIALSDAFVNPEGFTEEHFLTLEARGQLFLPAHQIRQDQVAIMSHTIWQEYRRFSKQSTSLGVLPCAIGIPVGWAGSELISYTTGENHFHMAVVLADNTNKDYALLKILGQRSGINIENNDTYQLFFLLLHELGHEFYPVMDRSLSEIATDIPTIINGLNLIRSKNCAIVDAGAQDIQKFLAIALFEACQQALYPNDGDELDRPYYLSSYEVINEFFENEIIKLSDDQQSFTWNLGEDTINTLIERLTTLHHELMADSSKFRHTNIIASERTQAFIKSLSQWQSEAQTPQPQSIT